MAVIPTAGARHVVESFRFAAVLFYAGASLKTFPPLSRIYPDLMNFERRDSIVVKKSAG